IWVFGSVVQPEKGESLIGYSPAANKFQLGLSEGLTAFGDKVTFFSLLPVTNKGWQKRTSKPWEINENLKVYFPDFYEGIGVMKIATQIYGMMVKGLFSSEHPDCILTYNANIEWAVPAILLSAKYKIPSCVIIADYTPVCESGNLQNLLRMKIQQRLYARFKGAVLLSQYSKEMVLNKPVLNLEGGIDAARFSTGCFNAFHNPCRVMYSGKLDVVNGIDTFLQAAEIISEENVEIWITGKGPMEEYVKKKARGKVKYWGFVNDEKLWQLLKGADIVVLPHKTIIKQNLYNFPSKVLEYLVSGKVIVSTKLPTLKKFKDFLFFYEDNPHDLAKKILSIINMSHNSIFQRARMGQEFVLNNYNWNIQAKRLHDFIGEVIDSEVKEK
ncbi:glycosyltransferase, partial [Thermodesulfovibrionales bacterium]|nr:glycosyltransferase [Thermodesulfovibrionales bacterium]